MTSKKQNKHSYDDAADADVVDLETFLHQMPKIELHAHLNGCIRESTLIQLAQERNVELSPLLHPLHPDNINTKCNNDDNTNILQNNNNNNNKVNKQKRSLTECFQIFSEIAKCVTDLNALTQITQEALYDFANDGVLYLELRSTPKVLFLDDDNNKKKKNTKDKRVLCTKKQYVETILKVMKTFEQEELDRYNNEIKMMKEGKDSSGGGGVVRLPMKARYILSINRADSVDVAMEHVDLAIELASQIGGEYSKYIVGLDLSGDPNKNEFKKLEPCFRKARENGLKLSIHCGELPCEQQQEQQKTSDNNHNNNNKSIENNKDKIKFAHQDTKDILSFQPDRLGHALLFTNQMYEDLEQAQGQDKKIPIETCPTSNVMTLELANDFEGDLVSGLRKHPRLKSWLFSFVSKDTSSSSSGATATAHNIAIPNYPISINTDDPGLFNTSPTKELLLVADAFFFNKKDHSHHHVKDTWQFFVKIVSSSIDHIFESREFQSNLHDEFTEQVNKITASLLQHEKTHKSKHFDTSK